jgi:hypothetical protein
MEKKEKTLISVLFNLIFKIQVIVLGFLYDVNLTLQSAATVVKYNKI